MSKYHEKLTRLWAKWKTPKAEIGRMLDVDRGHLSRIFDGKSRPTPDQFLSLSRFFGVTIESLIDDSYEEAVPIGEAGSMATQGGAAGGDLTDPDAEIMRAMNVMARELGPRRAIRRMMMVGMEDEPVQPGPSSPSHGAARPIGSADISPRHDSPRRTNRSGHRQANSLDQPARLVDDVPFRN